MNRRRFLIALAVAVPVAVFIPAKIAASWRPVKVALIEPPNPNGSRLVGSEISFRTHASTREIIFPTFVAEQPKLFNLATGKVRALKAEGIVAGGNGSWHFEGGKSPRIVVRQNAIEERTYPLPTEDFDELNAMPPDLYQESAIVAANAKRVEMVVGAHYYRWNAGTRVLERDTDCDMQSELANQAIARDGETLIDAGLREVSALSTQTGEFTRHDKLPKMGAEGAHISAFGAYSIYAPPLSNAMTWHVVETANAREIWQFQTNNMDDPVTFSPDEKYLVIGRGDRKVWEIHDLPTGRVVRTLPLVSGATSGAFSPDGATLYSVANGVLYRQRAR